MRRFELIKKPVYPIRSIYRTHVRMLRPTTDKKCPPNPLKRKLRKWFRGRRAMQNPEFAG